MSHLPADGFEFVYEYSDAAFSFTPVARPEDGSQLKDVCTGMTKSVSSRLYVLPVEPSDVVAILEVKTIDLILLIESATEDGAVNLVSKSTTVIMSASVARTVFKLTVNAPGGLVVRRVNKFTFLNV